MRSDHATFPLPGKVNWLFLDMNSYFASCEQQAEPRLRGKPVAVVPMMTDATCAIAASYEAKAFGIKTGTKIYDAKRMCPELICVPARHDLYVDYHQQFLKAIDRHIPVTEVKSIDEVACELDKVQQNPDVAVQLARDIKRTIYRDVGEAIRCSIGLSTNGLLAKIATDLQKPDGLVTLMPQDAPGILGKKPLTFIPGIGPGMEKRLLRAGIYTLADLYRLDMKHMRKIWGGVVGERYWYALRGVELPTDPVQKRVVGHSHVLDPEWRPVALAEVVARRLLLKAASRMRRYDMDATRLTLSMRMENTPYSQGARYAIEAHFHRACDNIQLIRHLQHLWHEMVRHHRITR
ncbi:MAG: impB/mucB/samB family protein, partial [Rickettsiales bacterium]|nr:impB/mucB/samB family protein [Rickettsiales bacterium]